MTNKTCRSCLTALACGAVTLLAGCGSGGTANTAPATVPPVTTAAGSPSITAVSETTAVWDSCTLSESALSAAGLDIATRTRIANNGFPAWQTCQWTSSDRAYELVVTASDQALEDPPAPSKYQDVARTEFYGRKILFYRSVQDTNKIGCYVATPAAFGSIVFTVRKTGVRADAGDACLYANRVGAALTNSLP
ncbi:hypothetical protein ACFXPS_44010 [Nocardia sp. NPDC059091]|uniref:hypothetical protein n=1 Tax=unclassified Nocardia TaxID=2637762 RepID=UPI0036B22CC6